MKIQVHFLFHFTYSEHEKHFYIFFKFILLYSSQVCLVDIAALMSIHLINVNIYYR